MVRAGVSVSTALSSCRLRSLQGQMLESHDGKHILRSKRTSLLIRCATEPSGTRIVGGKRIKVLQVGAKSAKMRDKVSGEPTSVKLLSRVQQLRLLTKAEKAGLLSAAEKAGLSLSTIEKLGLLSKAEELGVLSAATDPGTPGTLLTLALALLIVGPAFVYVVPEDAIWQIVVQFAVAILSILGGSAAFAVSIFVSTLQKSDE
ncbi:hypothetical protein KP509_07G016100 [Ceratopteris richardii]|uniref:Uncharacterized protein n=1 Tax=Ceratopteris richardii TaxID=49495 RepID=A0A8T2UEN6_CERRI|nr:hypothetical protein KP509_07G016100 [Ceratopteris richardii]